MMEAGSLFFQLGGVRFTIPYVPIYIAGVYERCIVGTRSVQPAVVNDTPGNLPCDLFMFVSTGINMTDLLCIMYDIVLVYTCSVIIIVLTI